MTRVGRSGGERQPRRGREASSRRDRAGAARGRRDFPGRRQTDGASARRRSVAPAQLARDACRSRVGRQRPMEVDLETPGSMFRRLPIDEQRWLSQGQFQLIVPLKAAGRYATGMLALTAKRSGLSYSAEELRLLSTLGAATGLVLDSLRLRSTPDSSSGPAARECVACSRITSPEATQCGCGGHVVDAAVPYMSAGRLPPRTAYRGGRDGRRLQSGRRRPAP